MILYPAIDLLDGRVVRLRQGAFNAVTEYDQTPAEAARAFGEAGTSWLHVVDLAGARNAYGLADRRGECVYAACAHYQKCFIESIYKITIIKVSCIVTN